MKYKFRTWYKLVLFFLFNILFYRGISNSTYQIQHYNSEDGLLSNRTVRVIEDARGYYWFGTLNGIQRFDGYEFKEFSIESARKKIPDDFEVHALFLTRDSVLLVGTSLGLLEFNEFEQTFVYIPFPDEHDEYRVTDIVRINDSTFFLNSHSPKGVFVYKRNHKIVEHAQSAHDSLMKSPNVRLVLKGSDSIYFFHIGYDLYQYNISDDNFTKCNLGEIAPNSYFHYGLTDKNDVFWILSATGVYYLPPGGSAKRLTEIDNLCPLHKQIGASIIPASDTSLYIGINWWGVVEVSINTKEVVSVIRKTETTMPELSSNQIYSLYKASDNSVWWCSDGAYRITQDTSSVSFLKSGTVPETENYAVLDILEDSRGRIWVGTDGGGLHRYIVDKHKTVPVHSLETMNIPSAKVIMTLHEDSLTNELWFGTYGDGVFRYNFSTKKSTQYVYSQYNTNGIMSNRIWDIESDNAGNILISSLCKSVSVFNPRKKSWKTLSVENGVLRDNCVTAFVKDSFGTVWFAYTEAGFDVYDEKNYAMKHHVFPTDDRVLNMFFDENRIFLACMYGMKIYDTITRTFISHPVQKTFEKVKIYDINKDSYSRYWIASEKGLYYFRDVDSIPTLSEHDVNFKNNVARRIIETRGGYLLVGGINGLLSVPVKHAENRNRADFSIHITDMTLFGKTISVTKVHDDKLVIDDLTGITLPYNKNYISLFFSTLNLSLVQDVVYTVKVDNFYSEWQQLDDGENAIDLPNLQPGTYTVHIRASLRGNKDVYAMRTFTLEITPPFWKTIWFIILVIVLISLIIIHRIWTITQKNKLLSQLVDERTQDLQQAHKKLELQFDATKESNVVIEMKNKELTETLNIKDKILGIIGHDFKNSLHTLINSIRKLQKNNLTYSPEKRANVLEKINTLTKNVSHQMVEILDWARSQMNVIDYNPIEINIESIVSDVVQLLQFTAQSKGISIRIQSDYSHNAYIDARMINTVFRNIISNAIKFSPEGSVISIAIQEHDNSIEVLCIDKGIGMKQEDAETVFTSFRSENIQKGTYNEQGTGLGLQIAYAFMKKNKGDIQINSELHEGTIVSVSLPKAQTIAVKKRFISDYDNNILSSEDEPTYELSVLLVEDNTELLDMMEEYLENQYIIYKATSGNDGFALAQETIPDIIISDVNIPGMHGLDMCTRIRKQHLTSHIPFIIITADKAEDIELQSYDLGAVDFIEKPFNISVLRKKVIAILTNRKQYKQKILSELSQSSYVLPESFDDEIINNIISYIKENYADTEFDIDHMTEEVGLSRSQLWRKMKAVLGKTPSELLKDVRLAMAVKMLKSGKYRISEIAFYVGFTDQRYFSRVFQKEFGKTPTEYKNNA
ncbi:MAG: response regulator [Bacteroidales bacterium]|nr:response regulator [Bacteroidales bacterium]